MSVRLALRPRRLSPLLVVLACAALRCTPLPGAEAPKRPLPAYAGHSIELFDDGIEPAAVGISLEGKSDPHGDRVLRERTQVGDAALRVRVTTVTVKDTDEGGTRYTLGLKTVEKLAGPYPPGDTFEIVANKGSPSSGVLRGLAERMTGMSFVAFVRKFVRPDGDEELHFHLAPDNPAEVAAVKDAAILANL